MIENLAAVFGMSVDDVLKIMIGLGALVTTVLGAAGKFMQNLNGAKRRSFVKIRRLEDLSEEISKHTDFKSVDFVRLISEMKADQRDNADAKDADE